jgi:hypothetical protein
LEFIGQSTEDEMVLAFLRAEKDAPRVEQALQDPGVRRLIENADVRDPEQNIIRERILGGYRGYGNMLFRRFPNDLEWHRARLTLDELQHVRYADHPTWKHLSGDTRIVADGAANYGKVPLDSGTTAAIQGIVDGVRTGKSFPELILVAEPNAPPDEWILVEGHARATAYAVAGAPGEVEVLIGFSAAVPNWQFF